VKGANMNELIDLLKELHSDVDFRTASALIDDCILDSFDIVSLIASISDRFDVIIPPEEIVPENFNSAESLYALIAELMSE
jgi:acyl carrier protein